MSRCLHPVPAGYVAFHGPLKEPLYPKGNRPQSDFAVNPLMYYVQSEGWRGHPAGDSAMIYVILQDSELYRANFEDTPDCTPDPHEF
jgi:hypothetical protein